jgi:hypothetical protein
MYWNVHLAKDDLYEGVEDIINAADFIEKSDGAQPTFIQTTASASSSTCSPAPSRPETRHGTTGSTTPPAGPPNLIRHA